jgi:hypothetical protein
MHQNKQTATKNEKADLMKPMVALLLLLLLAGYCAERDQASHRLQLQLHDDIRMQLKLCAGMQGRREAVECLGVFGFAGECAEGFVSKRRVPSARYCEY